MPRTAITGFGGSTTGVTDLIVTQSTDDALGAMRHAEHRGVILRGGGRAYGDAAQNSGGVTLQTASAGARIELDDRTGVVRADACVSLREVIATIVPHGRFLPVTPGTALATVGGAVAADVHGKNHHRDGTFGAHLTGIRLASPARGLEELPPGTDAFNATVGGMGLTGAIIDASFETLPIETSALIVSRQRTNDLEHTMRGLRGLDARHRYSVAWVDLLAKGGGAWSRSGDRWRPRRPLGSPRSWPSHPA